LHFGSFRRPYRALRPFALDTIGSHYEEYYIAKCSEFIRPNLLVLEAAYVNSGLYFDHAVLLPHHVSVSFWMDKKKSLPPKLRPTTAQVAAVHIPEGSPSATGKQ